MRIREDLLIRAHERATKDACRRDDDLIGWISVKFTGKLGGLHRDLRRELQKANSGVGKGLVKPLGDRARQRQTLVLDELGDFPARDRADADAGCLVLLEY